MRRRVALVGAGLGATLLAVAVPTWTEPTGLAEGKARRIAPIDPELLDRVVPHPREPLWVSWSADPFEAAPVTPRSDANPEPLVAVAVDDGVERPGSTASPLDPAADEASAELALETTEGAPPIPAPPPLPRLAGVTIRGDLRAALLDRAIVDEGEPHPSGYIVEKIERNQVTLRWHDQTFLVALGGGS